MKLTPREKKIIKLAVVYTRNMMQMDLEEILKEKRMYYNSVIDLFEDLDEVETEEKDV